MNAKKTVFECKIIFPTGKTKSIYANCNLAVDKGDKCTAFDNKGNRFEYDSVLFEDEFHEPVINFDLFSQDKSKFADNVIEAYQYICDIINDSINGPGSLKTKLELTSAEKTKDDLLGKLRKLKLSQQCMLLHDDFEDIYFETTPITADEWKFIKINGFRRLTQYSAFLILLYRNKENMDFVLHGKYDISNEDSIEILWITFKESYKTKLGKLRPEKREKSPLRKGKLTPMKKGKSPLRKR